MILLISPSKTLDEKIEVPALSTPVFLKQSLELANTLKKKSKDDLQALMDISPKLAELNYNRNQNLSQLIKANTGLPAILSFKGDVYLGLGADDFSDQQLTYANEHIRILSGLYGLLSPMDQIQPYRLEMGTRLKIKDKNNLYQYWHNKITKLLNEQIKHHTDKTIVNLASDEYFKALQVDKIKANLVHINFKEERNGKIQFISFNAKKARGMMCRYAVLNAITDHKDLQGFNYEGYYFAEELSDEKNWMFLR